MDLLPFFDAGVIIIIFTVVIKVIILPLSIKASKSQLEMKSAEKDLALIKEKYKDNKEEQAKQQFEYYKEKGINPFAGILILIIQLPILIGLYRVFLKSGLPVINTTILYSFVSTPENINMVFLHLINISQKSILLAVLAGLTTYYQISLASSPTTTKEENAPQGDLQKAMAMQMKYFFPILMTFIAYTISSAVALYLITSNIFAIVQEIYIRRKYHKHTLVV
jgi:YidC/Oxa1 family membrane protein insertase